MAYGLWLKGLGILDVLKLLEILGKANIQKIQAIQKIQLTLTTIDRETYRKDHRKKQEQEL